MSGRYKVIEKSVSGHCCFTATVIDTEKKDAKFWPEGENVCECFDKEDAVLIAKALNQWPPL